MFKVKFYDRFGDFHHAKCFSFFPDARAAWEEAQYKGYPAPTIWEWHDIIGWLRVRDF